MTPKKAQQPKKKRKPASAKVASTALGPASDLDALVEEVARRVLALMQQASPAPAASAPGPVRVPLYFGDEVRLVPTRPGFAALMPPIPTRAELAAKGELWNLHAQTCLVRVIAHGVTLPRYRSPGHVSATVGSVVELYCTRPDELSELAARGAIEPLARAEELVPLHGLRPASYVDPRDSGAPWTGRGPHVLTVDAREEVR